MQELEYQGGKLNLSKEVEYLGLLFDDKTNVKNHT